MQDFERAEALAGSLQGRLHGAQFPLSAIAEGAIRQHVCDYVDELKGLGLQPERVIIAVKRVASGAGISMISTQSDLDRTEKLLADMVGWCIERYYGPRPRAD